MTEPCNYLVDPETVQKIVRSRREGEFTVWMVYLKCGCRLDSIAGAWGAEGLYVGHQGGKECGKDTCLRPEPRAT